MDAVRSLASGLDNHLAVEEDDRCRAKPARISMADAPTKLVTWKQWVWATTALVGWAAYRLYRDYTATGGHDPVKVTATIVTLCVGLIIMIVVYRYANSPRKESKS